MEYSAVHFVRQTELDKAVPEKRILLVEDDTFVAGLTEAALRHDFKVTVAHTAEHARRAMVKSPPDLVLLDLGLPDEDGLVVARQLRVRFSDLPIIFLTARQTKDDVLAGLDVGGDDYIIKPFDVDVLIARIKAVLRRSNGTADLEQWQGAGAPNSMFEIDPIVRRVRTAEGKQVSVTRAEFDVMHALVNAQGRILSRTQLLDAISYGPDRDVDERVIDALVSKIRRKMNAAGLSTTPIDTVRGIGYRVPKQ